MKKVCQTTWVRMTALALAVFLGMISIVGITVSALNAEIGAFTSDQDSFDQKKQDRQKSLMQTYAYDMIYKARHNKSNQQAQKFEKYKDSNMNYVVFHRDVKDGKTTYRKMAGFGSFDDLSLEALERTDSYQIIEGLQKENPQIYSYELADYRSLQNYSSINSLASVLAGRGNWSVWDENSDEGTSDPERIQRVLYNKDTGRFYFQTKHYVFATGNLSLSDPDSDGEFKKNYSYVEGVGYCNHADGNKLVINAGTPWQIDKKSYSFFYLEGVRITKSLIRTVDSKTMPKVTKVSYIVNESQTSQYESIYQDYVDYYKDEEQAYVIVDKDYTQVKVEPTSWVSFDDEANKDSLKSGYVVFASAKSRLTDNSVDRLYMQDELLDRLHDTSIPVLIVTIVSGVLAVISGIFYWVCIWMKGRQEETCALHKIPFGVYEIVPVTIWSLAFSGYFMLATEGFTSISSVYLNWVIAGAFGLALVLMVTTGWIIGEFIARLRDKIFWKYSLVGILFHPVKRLGGNVIRAIGMIPRISLAYLGVSILQTIVIIGFSGYQTAELFSLFVLYKIVEVILLAMVVLQAQKIRKGTASMADGNLDHTIDSEHMFPSFKEHVSDLNRIREGANLAAQQRMKSERFKTELITNVSHDLKTPLTSVINYIDLLQKEDVTQEQQEEYLKILERQANRLKKLMQDLLDASKAASGAVEMDIQELDLQVLMVQAVGEYQEKMEQLGLDLMINQPEESVLVKADSRQLWRVFDNVLNNICKYALPNTRVYIDEERNEQGYQVTFRNISRAPLNISSDELMERFVRGDSSRHTEGSGLGLSIASNLMELMGGRFEIKIDGDLFKVILTF